MRMVYVFSPAGPDLICHSDQHYRRYGIGTCDQSCWLAEACKILLLLLVPVVQNLRCCACNSVVSEVPWSAWPLRFQCLMSLWYPWYHAHITIRKPYVCSTLSFGRNFDSVEYRSVVPPSGLCRECKKGVSFVIRDVCLHNFAESFV